MATVCCNCCGLLDHLGAVSEREDHTAICLCKLRTLCMLCQLDVCGIGHTSHTTTHTTHTMARVMVVVVVEEERALAMHCVSVEAAAVHVCVCAAL